jgi:hypothetical protein
MIVKPTTASPPIRPPTMTPTGVDELLDGIAVVESDDSDEVVVVVVYVEVLRDVENALDDPDIVVAYVVDVIIGMVVLMLMLALVLWIMGKLSVMLK